MAAHAARLALLIGNDQYKHVSELHNAVADADTMAKAFERAGYQVTVSRNRDLKGFKDDVRAFRQRIQGGDEVVLFYSGHGLQLGGDNFLLPVDVRADSSDQVRDDALALSQVLADLRSTRPAFTLAIIDACRDNPFASAGKAIGGRGLTGVAGANGQMVIYAAGEGQQALDRLGDTDPVRNGLFTRVFVKEMTKPGLPIDQVLKNVRVEVNRMARTVRHEQVPALYDQVLGTFYFYPPGPGVQLASINPVPAQPGTAPGGSAGFDLADLERADQQELEKRAQWVRWQQAMQAAFDKVAKLGDKTLQAQGWERFITSYGGQNNPHSDDDEALVNQARQSLAALKYSVPPTSPPSVNTGDRLPGTSFKDCDVCPEMIWIPSGKFTMGASDSEVRAGYDVTDRLPTREVTLGQKFAMGKYTITYEEWGSCANDGGCNVKNFPSEFNGGKYPVVYVNWFDAKAYAGWLSKKTGKHYRLPSEAEWEYAARAGTRARFITGECIKPSEANYDAQFDYYNCPAPVTRVQRRVRPVGSYPANSLGVYDMAGNVWQWVEDSWRDNYVGAPANEVAWVRVEDSRDKVIRGGSWQSHPGALLASYRQKQDLESRSFDIGFRLVREVLHK
jgi:formylglycine-generating enzyme required for sulfatase activity/uncharacterized caspase-like protein